MKKLWLIMLAVALAFGLVFGIAGCRDVPEKGPDATDDLEITEATEIGALLSSKGWNGNAGNEVSTDGNVAIFDITGSTDNQGFELLFPEEATGFLSLEVTFKLIEVTTLTGGANAKIGFKSAVSPATADVTPYDDHEIVFGTTAGVEKTQKFSLSSPNKLPNNVVYFSHNAYGSGASAGSKAPVKYKVEVTKLKFMAGEPVPCCTDCDVATCKDCSADKCEGECGTVCCVVFKGDTTTKVELVSGKVVHTNPALDLSGGTVVAADGTITMKEGAVVYYKFPADTAEFKIADYDYIDITYNLSDADKTSGGAGNLKARLMGYTNSAAYTGGDWVDWGAVGTGLTQNYQTWGDGGTGGFALRFNHSDKGTSGCDSIKLKITKIEFSKGTRYTVEFYSPMTPNNNNFASIQVLSGNSIGDRLPKVSNPGWTNIGWVDKWSPTTNEPDSGANTIVGSTAITSSLNIENGVLKLFAIWMFIPLSPVTLEAPANDTLFIKSPAAWAGSGFTDTTITIGGKKYWVVGDYREVGSAPGVAEGIQTKLIASDTDFTAIKAHHGLGYTRIYVDLSGASLGGSNWSNYATVTLTYDMIEVSTNGTASDEGSRGIQFKNNNGGSGGNFANGSWPNGTNDTPWLEAGEGKTFTIPIAEFTQGANLSIVKNGQSNGKQGAMLLRVTKIELKL